MLIPTESLTNLTHSMIGDKLNHPTVTLTPQELLEMFNKVALCVVDECIAAALANDDPFTAQDIGLKFGIN